MKTTLYDKVFKPKTYTLSNGKEISQRASRAPIVFVLVMIMTVIAWRTTGVSIETIVRRGVHFWAILQEMFPPNTNFLNSIWSPLFDTIQMSILGSFFGACLAIPFALLSSSNVIPNKAINVFCKTFLSILRTLPTLVMALIATFIFDFGTMAGTVAIFLFTLSYIGKLMYEHIENVDMGAFEAHESMGLTKVEAFRYAIVPDVLPTYLSVSLYALEGNIRHAAILGYVGAGGIGLLLDEQLGWRSYPNVGMILFSLMIVVFVIERVSEYFRAKLT